MLSIFLIFAAAWAVAGPLLYSMTSADEKRLNTIVGLSLLFACGPLVWLAAIIISLKNKNS